MREIKRLFPFPPWEGPPLPRFLWVEVFWPDVVRFLQGTEIGDIEEKMRFAVRPDVVPRVSPESVKKLKTLLTGYYLIAHGKAPDYVVGDTFSIVLEIWEEFFRYISRVPETVKERREVWKAIKAGKINRAVEIIWGDTPEVRSIKHAWERAKEALKTRSRADMVIAIDSLFHAEHLGGTVIDTSLDFFNSALEHYPAAFAYILAEVKS